MTRIAPKSNTPADTANRRYRCPATGWLVTLGTTGVRLTHPSRLVWIPGTDGRGPAGWQRELLATSKGRVFGPGCVVDRDLHPSELPTAPDSRSRLALEPVPAADPDTWIVNPPLTYRACAGCAKRVPVNQRTLMREPWTPRGTHHTGYAPALRAVPIDPGPHPAGTAACRRCDPRRSPRHD